MMSKTKRLRRRPIRQTDRDVKGQDRRLYGKKQTGGNVDDVSKSNELER